MVQAQDTGVSASSPTVSPVPASTPSAYRDIANALPEDMAWTYKETVRAGRLYHQWELVGPRGGIHVWAQWHVSDWSGDNWLGGIEGHSPISQSAYDDGKPSQQHCWLIGKPCWHDGSSLQFSEQISPMLPYQDGPFGDYEHRAVMSVMLDRYDCWLPAAQTIEAAAADETVPGSAVGESVVPAGNAPQVSALTPPDDQEGEGDRG